MSQAHRSVPSFLRRTALWAAISLTLAQNAHALLLGSPVVQSKVGEPLKAEAVITQITPEEAEGLLAEHASADLYQAIHIEQPVSGGRPLEVLAQVLVENGRHVLKLISLQPVTQRDLDLVLRIRWSTGQSLKNLTLSLDDASVAKPATPIVIPQTAQRSTNNTNQIAIQRGDTANALMAPVTPQGVSLEQMLLALVRQNPDAFVGNNVNRMKAGALVTVPTEEQARTVSREEARKEIRVQAKDFEAYRAELAARAPGGKVAAASRDAAGKLEAKIENKNLKSGQDKLTLSKPDSKDTGADKIAQQREAEDVATRAAELSRNIAELGKIAAATVSGAASPASDAASTAGVLPVDVPASAAEANGEWLNELRDNTLTPVGAGSLIGLLVLVALWRRRAHNKSEDGIQGLPPLNVKFNLDLPDNDHQEPVERAYIHDVATHMNDTHEHPHDHANRAHDEDDLQEDHSHHEAHVTRPTMEMPNISLDLDEPDSANSPYQVRIDLANELWNLGQLHTSKALMEEVANEASGADKEKALQWLAERA